MYFAEKLHASMEGLTDDRMLIHVMVSRCEVDLEKIKQVFKEKYEDDLYSYVKVREEERRL